MAKIYLEATDTTIHVSGPSSFLPLNKAAANGNFNIFLDNAAATADLSKIGAAAIHTVVSLPGKSTDYHEVINKGFLQILDSAGHVVIQLPIGKAATSQSVAQLHFADYAPNTTVHVGKPTGTSTALVLDHAPDAAPTVTLTSSTTTVNEGVTDAVTYTATLNHAATTALHIPYILGGTATATTDYTTTSTGFIDIAAGALTGILKLTTVADAKTEIGGETVTVALGTVTGATVNTAAVSTSIADTSLTPVTNNVAVNNAASTYTATAGVDIFTIAAGAYNATINGFGVGDKIVSPTGIVASLVQSSFSDNQIGLSYSAAGQTAVITLTGLTNAQDTLLFAPTDLNNAGVFGTGTFA